MYISYENNIIIYEIIATILISIDYFISRYHIKSLNKIIRNELIICNDLNQKKIYFNKSLFLCNLCILFITILFDKIFFLYISYDIESLKLINKLLISFSILLIFIPIFQNYNYIAYKTCATLFKFLNFIKKGIIAGMGILILFFSFGFKIMVNSKIHVKATNLFEILINFTNGIIFILILIITLSSIKLFYEQNKIKSKIND